MIITNLKFNFKDIFLSPRIALSGKKIFVFIQGNLFGFIVYWICSYTAFFLSGYPVYEVLQKYGLYPSLFGNVAEWYSWSIYYLGIIFWTIVIFLCTTTVSRITLMQLKGNDFFSINNAWSYTKKHWRAVIFSPVTILIILIIFVLTAGFLAFISYFPLFGELIFSLLFFIYFFGAIFTLYTLFVLIVSLIYTPAIVGLYEEDAMGTIFQSYSISFGHNWRIIFYNIILISLIFIGIEFFSWFCVNAIGLITNIFGHSWFGSPKIINISNYALSLSFPSWFSDHLLSLREHMYCIINIDFTMPQLFSFTKTNIINNNLSLSESFAGIILAFSYLIIGLAIISYGLSIFAVGETLMFITFKKLSDDDNLLDRNEKEEIDGDIDLNETDKSESTSELGNHNDDEQNN